LASRLIAETDELGRRTEYTYDRLGRMIRKTDPNPNHRDPRSAKGHASQAERDRGREG